MHIQLVKMYVRECMKMRTTKTRVAFVSKASCPKARGGAGDAVGSGTFLVAVAIKEAIQNMCLERMASMEGPNPFANNYSLRPMDAQAR